MGDAAYSDEPMLYRRETDGAPDTRARSSQWQLRSAGRERAARRWPVVLVRRAGDAAVAWSRAGLAHWPWPPEEGGMPPGRYRKRAAFGETLHGNQ